MIPMPQRDDKGRLQGEFYPLQKAELVALRKAKLINNAGFVHLALRYENPFCDRPITVIPKEFAIRWQMPESSVYEAVAKLKESNAVNIKSGKIIIEWSSSQQESLIDSQQEENSENPEEFWESRKNSGSSEKIPEVQKKFRKFRKNSGSSEKDAPEPLPDKDSSTPKTIKTYSNFIHTLSDSERENFEKFVREQWKKITAKNQEAGQEIVSMERFLSNPEDLNNWWEKFLKSAVGRAAKKKALATSRDWRNEECFDKWIWEAFNRGYEWVHENEAERSLRQNFHDWAFAVNAFEGVCL